MISLMSRWVASREMLCILTKISGQLSRSHINSHVERQRLTSKQSSSISTSHGGDRLAITAFLLSLCKERRLQSVIALCQWAGDETMMAILCPHQYLHFSNLFALIFLSLFGKPINIILWMRDFPSHRMKYQWFSKNHLRFIFKWLEHSGPF